MAIWNPVNKQKGQKQCDDVESTAIAAIGYDNKSGRLYVTYTNQRAYTYFGVSRQRYQAFCDAGSKGQYVNKQIKPNYGYARGTVTGSSARNMITSPYGRF